MRASSQNPLAPNTFHIGFFLAWGGVFVATLVFLLAGITQQGFWEDPTSPTTPLTQQVPRQNPAPENTEITRVLQLEEPASTRWPLLTQWLLRGSARLGRLEIAARLPSLVCMMSVAFLMILFLHRHGKPWESLLGVLALAATPAFLITGRTVNLEAPTVFFHTLFVLWGYEWITNGLHKRLWNFSRLFGVFVATVLAGGWFWGAVVTLGALSCALFFSKLASRRTLIILCSITGMSLAMLPLLYAINAPEWLVHAPNPALTIPTVKAPHALFTVYPVRVFFSTFPVSLIVFLAFLTVSDASTDEISPIEPQKKQIVSLRFFAGWLFMVVVAGAYWEMLVETAFFLGIFPLCAAAAVFLSRYIDILFQPLPAFVLAIGGVLIIRDFATYPQILPELFTTAEIPSVKLRLGRQFLHSQFRPVGLLFAPSILCHRHGQFSGKSPKIPLYFGFLTYRCVLLVEVSRGYGTTAQNVDGFDTKYKFCCNNPTQRQRLVCCFLQLFCPLVVGFHCMYYRVYCVNFLLAPPWQRQFCMHVLRTVLPCTKLPRVPRLFIPNEPLLCCLLIPTLLLL